MAWVVNGIRLVESHYMVYGVIERELAEWGTCVASNEAIGKDWMVNKSPDRVSHIISDLHKAGIIGVDIEHPDVAYAGAVRTITILKDFESAIRG